MTEQEKIQELLKPRFKVSAEYPESPYKIGDIEHDETWSENDSLANYPAIFKRLEWWEDRKPEEMPEYLKQEYDSDYDYDGEGYLPEVYKSGVEFDYMYSNDSHLHIASFKTGGGCSLSYLLPATLTEYQQYINSKQQQ